MDQTSRRIPATDRPMQEPFSRPFPGAGASTGAVPPFAALDGSPEAVLARLDLLSHLLDSAFVIPGTNRRVGLDAAIGLIPVVGDLITTVLSSYIVWEARRLGAPRHLVARMIANVAIDGAVGAIPLIGDLFDAAYKANLRNVALLRGHLEKRGVTRPGVIEGSAVRLEG